VNQFDALASEAEDVQLRNHAGTYTREVDPDVDISDLRGFDFIGEEKSETSSGMTGESWLDGVL
jgi:hypothetical protein